MENIIIICIIAIFAFFGIKNTIKHFKHESSCCGGGSAPKVRKKKLTNIVMTKTITVNGMSCEHCKNTVERAFNELDGVTANVNLKTKKVTISSEIELSDDIIRQTIEKAGYTVTM